MYSRFFVHAYMYDFTLYVCFNTLLSTWGIAWSTDLVTFWWNLAEWSDPGQIRIFKQ